MAIVLRRWFQIAAPLVAFAALPLSACWGWCVVDAHTRCMWARTWYGQNSVEMPVNDYYIPRIPANCGSNGYRAGAAYQPGVPEGGPNQYGAYPYPVAAATSFEPMQFERLGKIPNELEIGGAGLPGGGALPSPVPRR